MSDVQPLEHRLDSTETDVAVANKSMEYSMQSVPSSRYRHDTELPESTGRLQSKLTLNRYISEIESNVHRGPDKNLVYQFYEEYLHDKQHRKPTQATHSRSNDYHDRESGGSVFKSISLKKPARLGPAVYHSVENARSNAQGKAKAQKGDGHAFSGLAPSATFGNAQPLPSIDEGATADELYVKVLPVQHSCKHFAQHQVSAHKKSKQMAQEEYYFKRVKGGNNPEHLIMQEKYLAMSRSSKKLNQDFQTLLSSIGPAADAEGSYREKKAQEDEQELKKLLESPAALSETSKSDMESYRDQVSRLLDEKLADARSTMPEKGISLSLAEIGAGAGQHRPQGQSSTDLREALAGKKASLG